ncbi:redoxin domain-containing protein [Pedobacter sp. HMF7647]|uniref:Redoxin domain-containing protein n=1 Tax=Hufsiella arboris TaxID=2695275 RepID=A0A7K1Y489_9SPHI|nr:SCO family protein [Hufsiella arboris]MXV49392.1 redoxin domain-containing protein [Hufsiella arboris]
MKQKFSLKKLVILVVVLALPGFCYYLLTEKGKNRYRPLSYFGPKKVAPTFHKVRGKLVSDTIYHQVREFQLTNQAGNQLKFAADTSKITVVNFFYTRCPSFCRNMNQQLKRVVDTYSRNHLLTFLSISVDPDYDSPAVLKKYADSYQAKAGKWDFVTGDKSLIYSLAKDDFLLDAVKDTLTENNIIHSPMLVLIDPKRRIRGYYDSNLPEQVDKLTDEIKVLIAEELRNIKEPVTIR